MFNSINLPYRKYLKDYFAYSNEMREPEKKPTTLDFDYVQSPLIKLVKYSSNKAHKQNFLVIPSLFNSSRILCLGKKQNFIEILLDYGDVYLINWQQSENNFLLEDYILETTKLLVKLTSHLGPINVAGHCFGGNIAIGAGSLKPDLLSSLTLLTTPWDYSHFNNALIWYKLLALDKMIQNLKTVPKIYLQMLFFLLFPNQFLKKVNNYYKLELEEEKQIYMQVEYWLQSGINIPVSLYQQFIDDVIAKNIFYTNQWQIEENKINPENIIAPVCIISAINDQIAPVNSTLTLHRLLKNSTLIKVKGGHISYLVNSDQDFINQYISWLKRHCERP